MASWHEPAGGSRLDGLAAVAAALLVVTLLVLAFAGPRASAPAPAGMSLSPTGSAER